MSASASAVRAFGLRSGRSGATRTLPRAPQRGGNAVHRLAALAMRELPVGERAQIAERVAHARAELVGGERRT